MKHSTCSFNLKTAAKLCGIAAGCAALPVWLLAPGRAPKARLEPFLGVNYAHRGLHTEDFSTPENSLKAFEAAASAGYGMELDVQLSKDGQVVVFHDDSLERVCGVKAAVKSKTYAELKAMSLRGTGETVPLFSDVLSVIAGRGGPLIVELKLAGRRNRELCEKTYEILSRYSGLYCVESFDPFIVLWFRLHHKEVIRGQLAMGASMYRPLGPVLRHVLAGNLFNPLTRPHFIAYDINAKFPLTCRVSRALGCARFGWTAHSPESEKNCDSVIFEFCTPEAAFTAVR